MSRGNRGSRDSFRSGDFTEPDSFRRRSRAPRTAAPPQAGSDEGQRPCARGEWCASSVIVVESGKTHRRPALGTRSFCDRDRGHVARCLEEIPGQYAHLAAELGNPSGAGLSVHVPFGPRIPIRVDIDALMKLMAESLVSWHERVADIAHLDFPTARMSRMRREAQAVQRAELVLSAHLDALLSLGPGPVTRAFDLRALDSFPEDAPGVVHSVFAELTLDLSGADAGMEIISLRHLARALLGETKAKPEELVGVPCRADGCGWRAVYRAELPSREDEPAWWTECARCGDKMSEADYREWVALCAAHERNRRKVPATLENMPGVA